MSTIQHYWVCTLFYASLRLQTVSTVWVGKLFRQKAMYLARERLKAAVKVSLPINMSYAEVVLWTNRWVQISQDISLSENRVKVQGNYYRCPVTEN